MNTQTRFVHRLNDHVRTGDYGYAIERFASRPHYAQRAVYVACAIGFVAALVFNNFHWN